MASRFAFTALLLAILCWSPCLATSDHQQYMGPSPAAAAAAAIPFEFRDAVLDDMDDFTTVVFDAFSPAPEWRYMYQFHDQYPGYTWHCLRDAWKSLFQGSYGFRLNFKVIAVPDKAARSGSRVVSISVWNPNKTSEEPAAWPQLLQMSLWSGLLPGLGRANSWDNCSLHLDINETRAKPWMAAVGSAEKKYCDDVYDRRVELAGLATHPKWDGNGFAAVHLHWGLAMADELELPATLTGTPAAHALYRSVEFEDVFNITQERLDGKGTIWYEIMARSAKNGTS